MANAPPSSYHLNDSGMLTRSRQRNNSNLSQISTSTTAGTTTTSDGSEQQYAPGASHLFDDSESDSPLSSAYTTSPMLNSSRLSNHGGGRHSRAGGGRDSDASASGASSFGPERTSGASSPIASTSYHTNSGNGGAGHPGNVNPATGKRKRSRVTPVQLAHLERVFAKDRSPTAAKRKELAEVLGMNERQTQVWFQNRRAKAKLLEQRARSGGGPGEAGSRPPVPRAHNSGSSSSGSYVTGASSGIEGGSADILGRIHEDEAVFVIPCSDLCIGTFRRVSAGLNDLIGYTCESKRFLAWYVYSAGTGFKMEIPFDNIVSAEMTEDATQGQSRAIIHLSGHPAFYREFSTAGATYGAHLGFAASRQWQRCDDWTENRQASSALIHQIVGRTTSLEHALAPFLLHELNDAEGEIDEGQQSLGEGTTGTGMHHRTSASSRRSSGASGSPVTTIQTPSLLSVLSSPAPPSSYRDPFGPPRSAQVRTSAHTYASAPQLHHTRKRSRSDASLPFGHYSQFDHEFDQNGRHSTGGGPSPGVHHHPHHSNLHPLVNPSIAATGRLNSGPFSAGPFGPSDGSTFAAQQDQSFAHASYPDFDQLLSYGAGSSNSSAPPAVTAAPAPTATASEDAFLVDSAPVPIARSYSSSNASSTGRPTLYMGGVARSRPSTSASHHSMSHSPFDAHPPVSMAPLPHPHSQLQLQHQHQQQPPQQHLQHTQEQGQLNSFDVIDVGLQSHLGSSVDVGLDYENAMTIGAMGDINLMFQHQPHSEYATNESIHQQQSHQQPAQSHDSHFTGATHDTSSFLQGAHTDIGSSAIPADVPLPSSPSLGVGHDNPQPLTEFS